MKTNDYVIAQEKQGKPFLVQVKEVTDDLFTGVLEINRRHEHKTVELRRKDVVVNLGKSPRPGDVYKIDVSNIYRTTLPHDWWGNIHFYVKLDKATLKVLRNSLDRTATRLDKMKLTRYTDASEIEIKAKKGKYAGMYLHAQGKERRNLTWYAPEWAQGNSDMMDYVIFHEFGHCVRYNGLSNATKLRQQWLRLFQESIKPIVIPEKAFSLALKHLRDQRSGDDELGLLEALKNFASEGDKQAKTVTVLKQWLKQVHHLSTKELSIAWSAEDFKYIESVWPKSSVDSSDLAPVISEYSTKNVEELFAECFAFHAQKKKLPAAYEELLDKSLSWARKSTSDHE